MIPRDREGGTLLGLVLGMVARREDLGLPFEPFAVAQDVGGCFEHFEIESGPGRGVGQRLVQLAGVLLRRVDQDPPIRALAFIRSSELDLGPKGNVPAVSVTLEERGGACREVFAPIERDEDGNMQLGDPFALRGVARVFPEDPEASLPSS